MDKASGFADSSVEAYPSLKPQPKNMNIEQIHQESGKPSSPVLDPTDALICIFKDLERTLSLVLV